MELRKRRRYDRLFAIFFASLSLLLIVLLLSDESFFTWAFERHQNRLSWYLRPLFLIPFCYFSYRKSFSGVWGTVFLLLTSMFWFPKPETVDENVRDFLRMEKDYLTGDWGVLKILIALLIPVSLCLLALAFWKRSLWLGISVLVFIAVAKTLWSALFGGRSGSSVLAPAYAGLVVCVVLITAGFKRLEKKKKDD